MGFLRSLTAAAVRAPRGMSALWLTTGQTANGLRVRSGWSIERPHPERQQPRRKHSPLGSPFALLFSFNPPPEGHLAIETQTIGDKTNAAGVECNRVVHDVWYVNMAGEPHQHIAMPKGAPRFGIYPKKVEAIKDFIARVERRIDAINRLSEKIAAARTP
jgi:hypothetical protein